MHSDWLLIETLLIELSLLVHLEFIADVILSQLLTIVLTDVDRVVLGVDRVLMVHDHGVLETVDHL